MAGQFLVERVTRNDAVHRNWVRIDNGHETQTAENCGTRDGVNPFHMLVAPCRFVEI